MGNPFGKLPGGMDGLAQRLMKQAQQAEASLATEMVEGQSGGGVVKVVVNGKSELQELTISKEVVDPENVEMLQDLIITAMREAISKANTLHEEKLKSVIPPGFGIR
jgi:DNA-binding YbaB/EbfC family protein